MTYTSLLKVVGFSRWPLRLLRSSVLCWNLKRRTNVPRFPIPACKCRNPRIQHKFSFCLLLLSNHLVHHLLILLPSVCHHVVTGAFYVLQFPLSCSSYIPLHHTHYRCNISHSAQLCLADIFTLSLTFLNHTHLSYMHEKRQPLLNLLLSWIDVNILLQINYIAN